MRSNSASTSFFNNRFLISSGIVIAMLVIFFTASSFKKNSDIDLRLKQVNLIIRQIGHRLLLQAGDSTSRVLPVTGKEGTFLLKFEKQFAFSHDSLMVLSRSLLLKELFPSGYTVTVHDCRKAEIVYGFQLNNTTPDLLACNGRAEPRGCYTIEFAFPDFYEEGQKKKTGTDHLTALTKVDLKEVNPKSGELKTKTVDVNGGQSTALAKIGSQKINPKVEALEKSTSDYRLRNVVFGGILVLLCVALLIGPFGKKFKPALAQNQKQALINKPAADAPAMGKYLFDAKTQRLLLGTEVIALTDKETKVLELLHKNFGELIPRDTLMQEVWINEGVITGRSLDMFISKLRKKLSGDPDLRITNIHGKGYRLETVTDFNT